MSKKKYIPIAEFCEGYDVTYKSLIVRKSTGWLPLNIFKKVKGVGTYIDENYFKRRLEFNNKIIQDNQDFYTYITQHTSSSQLASLVQFKFNTFAVGTFTNYFSWGLFATSHSSLKLRLSKTHWTFNKWIRLTLRDLDITIEDIRDALYT